MANSIKYDRVELRDNPNISCFCALVEKPKFKQDASILKAFGTSFSVYAINKNYIWVQKPATKYNKEEYERIKSAFSSMEAMVWAECNF